MAITGHKAKHESEIEKKYKMKNTNQNKEAENNMPSNVAKRQKLNMLEAFSVFNTIEYAS